MSKNSGVTLITFLIDLDDFNEFNNQLDLLTNLYCKNPKLKFNLFTIPARCSLEFMDTIKGIDWIDMIPHGFEHKTSRECEHWSIVQCEDYLDYLDELELTKGFKAPGWIINDNMYSALLERGYWVADQAYNNDRRPKELKAYLLDSSNKIHGHIGHLGGYNANSLELIYNTIAELEGEFAFIKDLWT